MKTEFEHKFKVGDFVRPLSYNAKFIIKFVYYNLHDKGAEVTYSLEDIETGRWHGVEYEHSVLPWDEPAAPPKFKSGDWVCFRSIDGSTMVAGHVQSMFYSDESYRYQLSLHSDSVEEKRLELLTMLN